ncbi:helix-turn-helix transcriptional regulator [Marinicella sp. W31]|uniref:helix-turn-helix transcriptional regulator n=1 Tax=Marinicella sp. W31 TaxID=3023713 RepID=UPI0037565DA3
MKLQPTKYLGKTKHMRLLANYCLSISYHDVDDESPEHSHLNPYLSLNLGGKYLEKGGFSENTVKPGDVILRPSDYSHQNTFKEKSNLCFNIEALTKNSAKILALLLKKKIYFTCFEIIQILTKTFNNYLDDELDCLITETILQKLDIQDTDRKPAWYFDVMDKVKNDYDQSLSLNLIADCVSLHPNYLARKFKSLNGNTLGDYIRHTRLENACLKLNSKKRLTDISIDTGFYDQSHFSNSFRKTFDISPRQLRDKFLG